MQTHTTRTGWVHCCSVWVGMIQVVDAAHVTKWSTDDSPGVAWEGTDVIGCSHAGLRHTRPAPRDMLGCLQRVIVACDARCKLQSHTRSVNGQATVGLQEGIVQLRGSTWLVVSWLMDDAQCLLPVPKLGRNTI